MNELNARRIEFRNNRKELLNKLSDISNDIDANKLIRKIKLGNRGLVSQTDLHTLNHTIDVLTMEYNTTQKQLTKLESENPSMNF